MKNNVREVADEKVKNMEKKFLTLCFVFVQICVSVDETTTEAHFAEFQDVTRQKFSFLYVKNTLLISKC